MPAAAVSKILGAAFEHESATFRLRIRICGRLIRKRGLSSGFKDVSCHISPRGMDLNENSTVLGSGRRPDSGCARAVFRSIFFYISSKRLTRRPARAAHTEASCARLSGFRGPVGGERVPAAPRRGAGPILSHCASRAAVAAALCRRSSGRPLGSAALSLRDGSARSDRLFSDWTILDTKGMCC